MQDFDYAQIQPNLSKQFLLRDAAASPAPTALLTQNGSVNDSNCRNVIVDHREF